jgi:hypothetical protein
MCPVSLCFALTPHVFPHVYVQGLSPEEIDAYMEGLAPNSPPDEE